MPLLLYYYNSNRLGELDFVIAYEDAILPIEVQRGKDHHIHSALNNCTYNDQYEIKEAFVFADCILCFGSQNIPNYR